MKKVFISHASRDLETVKKLATELKKRGIDVWLAPEQISMGDDYAEELVNGIESCDATIMVLSIDSMKSRHVRREMEIANDLGHRFYPVRLLELALAQEFAYFLRTHRWVDLFDGDVQKKYDELAQAILAGRDLEQKNARRNQWLFWVSAVAALLMVIAGAIGISIYQSRITASLKTNEPFSDGYPETLATLQRLGNGPYKLAPLVPFRLHLYTPYTQRQPIAVQVRESGGRVIAQESLEPVGTIEDGYEFQFYLLQNSGPLDVCLIFQDDDGSSLGLLKKLEGEADYDGNRSISQLSEGDTCDTLFGSVAGPTDIAQIWTAKFNALFEESNTYRLIDNIEPPQSFSSDQSYVFNVSVGGGVAPNPNSPVRIELVIETGPDGENWPENAILVQEPVERYASEFDYKRPLDANVRACVISTYRNGRNVFHETLFERVGLGPEYVAVSGSAGPQLTDDSAYCRQSIDPTADLIAKEQKLSPLEAILPIMPTLALTDRPMALAEIQRGNPTPYGPGIGGIHLGMAFDTALVAAQRLLPRASVNVSAPPEGMLVYGGVTEIGPVTRLEDPQNGSSITLMSRPLKGGATSVSAILFHSKLETNIPSFEDVGNRALELFGDSILVSDSEFGYSDARQMYWAGNRDSQCQFMSLIPIRDIGPSYINRADCGIEISLDAYGSESGRGIHLYSVGIYDFAALGAPAE